VECVAYSPSQRTPLTILSRPVFADVPGYSDCSMLRTQRSPAEKALALPARRARPRHCAERAGWRGRYCGQPRCPATQPAKPWRRLPARPRPSHSEAAPCVSRPWHSRLNATDSDQGLLPAAFSLSPGPPNHLMAGRARARRPRPTIAGTPAAAAAGHGPAQLSLRAPPPPLARAPARQTIPRRMAAAAPRARRAIAEGTF
jgi:hypothetical protein